MDDRVALQDVMLRYAAGVDDRDFEAYAAVFTEDVEVIGFDAEPIVGREAWMAFVKEALKHFAATQHMLGPTLASVAGDRAQCRTDLQAVHERTGRTAGLFVLWATYETDMLRTADGWKISRHRLIRRAAREW